MSSISGRAIWSNIRQKSFSNPPLRRSFCQTSLLSSSSKKSSGSSPSTHKGDTIANIHQTSTNNPFISRPGPLPLPAEDQKEFEELVRKAQAPLSTSPKTHASGAKTANVTEGAVEEIVERHPDAPKPLKPDFVGDVNPVTGERGGPKTEPLKHGDWSFGGKVTDF